MRRRKTRRERPGPEAPPARPARERAGREKARLPVVLLVGAALVLTGRVVADGTLDARSTGPAARSSGGTPSAQQYDEGGASTWYCAAGTVGGPADHHLIIDNPSDESVEGTLSLSTDGSSADRDRPTTHPLRVAAGSQREVRVGDLDDPLVRRLQEGAVPHRSGPVPMAVVAEFDGEVTVSHHIQGPHGEDEGPCHNSSSPTWHTAWGATTRDASFQLVLFNPFPNDVVVDARFSTEAGVREPVRWQGLAVPAGRAVMVDVGEDVTRREQVAVTIEARSGSLVVEGLQEFDGSLGSVGLSLTPTVPVGETGAEMPGGRVPAGGEEFVALYNPGDRPVEVEVQVAPYRTVEEAPAPFTPVVRGGQSLLVELSDVDRVDTSRPYRIEVDASAPVVSQHEILRPADEDSS